MSQGLFTTIDPSISGTTLATTLNSFKDALVSGISGTSRPAQLLAGGMWVDTTNDPTSWSFKMYTGVADVEIFKLYLSTSLSSISNANSEFDVQRVSADTTGAILKLIKQRIASNGQVLDGDVVGEIRFVGRANDSSNPVVAKVIWTSTDNETSSAYGGTLSFQSVPDASGTLTEHFRLIGGLFETVVPQKLNSLRIVGQNVATAATIAQLDASKVLVEMTGSTVSSIQGLNSGQDSQVVTIHNRSTAVVTLKHQDAGAAAADRMKLPSSGDYVLVADASATLYYCATDARWKLLSTADKSFNGYTLQTFYGPVNTFTPTSTFARVRAYIKRKGVEQDVAGLIDLWNAAYAWGPNANGQLGLGDVTSRSSPVAVLSGQLMIRMYGSIIAAGGGGSMTYGINSGGAAYAWGVNANGQLGLGDVTPRSSPVAVLGGLKFHKLFPRDTRTYGLTPAQTAYAWGLNTNGELGVGDVTPRSSPVAVLGGLTFVKLIPNVNASASSGHCVAITKAGAAYAWGENAKGTLGVGDVTPRSSPVAVLGSLVFNDITGNNGLSYVGLTTAGAAYAWGENFAGQLGVGDVTARSSPVAVLGGITFKQIATHPQSASSYYGLTSTGVAYAWGINTNGELGVGDVASRSSPVAVLGGLTFAKIFPYRQCVIGLTPEGVAYAWGGNTAGILGVGDVIPRSSPVAVLGGLIFNEIIFGNGAGTDSFSTDGVQADGTMYGWGANAQGAIGDGTTTAKSSPVAVIGGFRPDMQQPTTSADLTLTVGTAYTILIADGGMSAFGSIPMGWNVSKIEVEYLQ